MSFIAPALRRQLASAAPRSSLRFASTQAVTHSSESVSHSFRLSFLPTPALTALSILQSISKLVPVEVYPLVALVGCISIVGTGFILNAFGQEGVSTWLPSLSLLRDCLADLVFPQTTAPSLPCALHRRPGRQGDLGAVIEEEEEEEGLSLSPYPFTY